MPPKIASLFETIRNVYSRNGFNIFTPWQGWPTLNEYYPSPKRLGDFLFIETDEGNHFNRFSSLLGSHPVLGSHVQGNNAAAFTELTKVLGLELVDEVNAESVMTYPGCRIRYYKITKLI